MNLLRRENDKHLRFWAPTPLPPATPRQGTEKFDSSNLSLEWGKFRGNYSCVLPNFVRKFAAEIFPGQWREEEEEREGGREGERRGGGEERSGADVGQNRSAVFRCGKIARQNCLQGSVAGKSSLRQNRLQNSAAEKSASKTENIQQSEVSKKEASENVQRKKRKHEKPKDIRRKHKELPDEHEGKPSSRKETPRKTLFS